MVQASGLWQPMRIPLREKRTSVCVCTFTDRPRVVLVYPWSTDRRVLGPRPAGETPPGRGSDWLPVLHALLGIPTRRVQFLSVPCGTRAQRKAPRSVKLGPVGHCGQEWLCRERPQSCPW